MEIYAYISAKSGMRGKPDSLKRKLFKPQFSGWAVLTTFHRTHK
jgi:hypothetical protein